MDSIRLYELYKELKTSVEQDCPNAPCITCMLNRKCHSFLDYRKKHPEYDEKCALYVAAHKALAKQRSLCEVDDREQVSQQGGSLKSNKKQKGELTIMRLDFSEVTDAKVLEEGQYEFTIVKADEKVSKNGTAMLVIDAKTEDGGFVRDNICLEGAGAFKAKQFFNAIGVSEDDAQSMAPTDLIGICFVADIVLDDYNDRTYPKVKKYIA